MKHFATLALVGIALAACQTTNGDSSINQRAVKSIDSVDQLLALGGRQLNADEIRNELLDRKLDGDAWIWTISSNGTANSAANDGSWTSTSTWELEGNKYCRQSETVKYKCSDIYEVGGVYRFTKEGGNFETWSVTAS